MAGPFKRPQKIHGVSLPPRRFTAWAALYFVGFVAVPVLALGLAIDLALYYLFREAFDSCYAILCLLD